MAAHHLEHHEAMRELNYKSKSIFSELLAARDSKQDFALIIEGGKAKRLFRVVPYYEKYREVYLRSSHRKLNVLLSFALRALLSPFFWGLCIMVDFEASESRFQFSDQTLRIEFYFQ